MRAMLQASALLVLLCFHALVSQQEVNALENGVGRTPLMGWMAWIRFRCNINCDEDPQNCVSEQLIKSMADHLAADGWKELGYEYVSIDDCWQASKRADNGTILADPTRFPSGMKALGDYIHSKGLKFGMYTAMGDETCGGFPAFGCPDVDHCTQAKQDVETYLSWGIDYIKVDSCRGSNAAAFNTTHPLISSWFLEGGQKANRSVLYHPSGFALRSSGHTNFPIQYNLMANSANMWRHYQDMQPIWSEVEAIIDYWAADNNKSHPETYPQQHEDFLTISRPGVFQDPDALLVGNGGGPASCHACAGRDPPGQFCPDHENLTKPCICCGGLTPNEEQSNMAFWAMWSAPLEIAADLRNISATSAAILQNPEVIAVAQDPLVIQGRRVWNNKENGLQLWRKKLDGGGIAVLLYNSNKSMVSTSIQLQDVGFASCDHVVVRDLINRVDKGTHVGEIIVNDIPAHGVSMMNMTVVWH